MARPNLKLVKSDNIESANDELWKMKKAEMEDGLIFKIGFIVGVIIWILWR